MPSRVVVVIIIIIIIIVVIVFVFAPFLHSSKLSSPRTKNVPTKRRRHASLKAQIIYHHNEGGRKKERKNVLLRHRPFREASHRRRDVHQSDADVRRQIFQSQRKHEFDEQHRARNFTLDYFRCVVLFLFFSLLRAFVVVRYSSSLTKNNTFSLCAR